MRFPQVFLLVSSMVIGAMPMTIFAQTGGESVWSVSGAVGGTMYVGQPGGAERPRCDVRLSAGSYLGSGITERLSCERGAFTAWDGSRHDWTAWSSDLVFDLMAMLRPSRHLRFKPMPYVGCGYMHDSDAHTREFGLHYGVVGETWLTDAVSFDGELSCHNTMRNFDGRGCCCKLGDQIFSLRVGVTYHFGRKKAAVAPTERQPAPENHAVRDSMDRARLKNALSLTPSASELKQRDKNDYIGYRELKKRLSTMRLQSNDNKQDVHKTDNVGGQVNDQDNSYSKQHECRKEP